MKSEKIPLPADQKVYRCINFGYYKLLSIFSNWKQGDNDPSRSNPHQTRTRIQYQIKATRDPVHLGNKSSKNKTIVMKASINGYG